MSDNINVPRKVTTKSLKIRRVIFIGVAALLLIAVGVGIGFFFFANNTPTINATDISTLITRSSVDDDTEVMESEESQFNIDAAKSTITQYYSLLSAYDQSGLAAAGFTEAASAISMGWLEQIEYSVEWSTEPDVTELPDSVTMYAGCYVYKISDFFTTEPTEVIHSNATGNTTYEGWVYYNRSTNKWVVVDPTIPTAISASESTTVTRSSSDSLVKTTMQSSGALSNPWWCVSDIYVEITSSASSYDVSVATRHIDDGVTVSVPDELLAGISRVNDGNSVTISGICSVVRGVTSGFGVERIGSDALSLDGNIVPVDIQTSTENITPLYAMGDAVAVDLAEYAAEAQSEEYSMEITTNEEASGGNTE